MSKFTKEQFNSFLKEYIIYVTSKPTENTIQIFNEYFNIKDGKILVEMIKHILFSFIQNEKLSEKEEIQIFIYIKNLLNFFFKYENNNHIDNQDLNELTNIIYELIWESNERIKSKSLNNIIIQLFKIIIIQKSKDENNNLLNKILNDINKLSELSYPICNKILQLLKYFLKNSQIHFNNEKVNSIIIILNGILNYLINNLKNLQEEIFIENINLFKILLDISIIGIKFDIFYELYQSGNNYFILLQKTLINILNNIDNLQIKNNGNLINVISTVLTFKRKIIKFLIIIILKDSFSFNYLIDLFKFAIIYLNNLINSFNVNEKLKNIGFEENNDLYLKYIKVILILINVILKQKNKEINELFKENAFDFIQKILLVFIDNELTKNEISDLYDEFDNDIFINKKKENRNNKNQDIFDKSIFSISLFIIKEIINLYPFILELICNLSFNLIKDNKSYLGYFLIIQFLNLNKNINISNYINNNIEMILSNIYNENIDNSEITINQIINFLYSFNKIIMNNEENYIKCLNYIYNNIYCNSIKIRKNCSIKFCLMIKEAKNNELIYDKIIEFIHKISYEVINKLINNDQEYINFIMNCLENYIFINDGSFLFSLFKAITVRINKEFNSNNNKSDILINNCFNLLIQFFKNEIYNKTLFYFLNEAIDIFSQNIIPLLQYIEMNNYDDQIFEILFYLLNENIQYNKINEILEHLIYIPDYISKSNFMSNSIFKLLNFIIDNDTNDIKCNTYLQNIFNQIVFFCYKKQETSLIKIFILLQCFVYSNKNLTKEFISKMSNYAYNFIINSNNEEKSIYFFNTILTLISFIFSLFKNYHTIIMDIINSDLCIFIKIIEFYFTFDISFNIIQAKFILFSLCNIINLYYYKENTIIFIRLCIKLIYKILLYEKIQNKEKQNIFIKSNFIKSEDEDDDDLFEDKQEFDYELKEINDLYTNTENIISKWKNIDEFKIFSECYYSFYNKNKNIIEDGLLMKMNDNEKRKLINLLHTNRIESKNYENNNQIKFNENGGIPRKIIKIKKKNNNALIELNNNIGNQIKI